MNIVTSAVLRISLAVIVGSFWTTLLYADDIYINPKYPITGHGGPALSPPHVGATLQCATHVFVDSFVPRATVKVFLNGSPLIGGPVAPKYGFFAVPLTQALNTGDKITATQTVNGVTSAPSEPMVVGAMPAKLPPPDVGKAVFACGRVVPVTGLVSGVTVEVRDETLGTTIGNGSTPNDWGDDWAPVVTSSLTNGHNVAARQHACTGVSSPFSSPQAVNADPSPVPAPTLDPPVVGNDTITAHQLLTGSEIKAFDHATSIGGGYATGQMNWISVSPNISASSSISALQALCGASGSSPPVTPVSHLDPPKLVGPICPGQHAATVRDSTMNATLVLVKNGVVVGYGGAGPGDVPLDIAPIASFAENDSVEVVEYLGSILTVSNTVKVGCHDVITYHNDSQRTGWNQHENTLTSANVNMNDFGLIAHAELDDQVEAQPLIVANQAIEGMGVRAVAYVVTANNSVYAIDAFDGTKLKHVNLGTPVPLPLSCTNNGPAVGINSTPTIDVKTKTLYVIDYVMVGSTPTHRLHALDLTTLKDKPGSPVTVAATNTLKDGSTYHFDSSVQRQRPGLLQANGNIYAGFGAFCDFKASLSRGWVLGWEASNLKPLAHSELLDKALTAPSTFNCYFTNPPDTSNHPCFLSSVWMSGFGLASDEEGNLFFTTGNTAQGIYDSATNLAESMVKLSPDLSKVLDFFTPADVNALDAADNDYGSGGALVLPNQPGPKPRITIAAGKKGDLFIVNRDTGQMGGFHNPNVPASVAIDDCWCGPSYFKGADNVGRVVSSGGHQVKQWTVNTASTPALTLEASAPALQKSDQDGGFFTSVSSDGNAANTAIIWAVGRPVGSNNVLTLYAFDATASGGTLKQLWSGAAGTWPNTGGNANLVPTVANGMVYVASYKELRIFGLVPPEAKPKRRTVVAARVEAPPPPSAALFAAAGPVYWGTIRAVSGSRVTLELRNGRMLTVDVSKVLPQATSDFGAVGRALAVTGTVGPDGVLAATSIMRAKGPSLWEPDREN